RSTARARVARAGWTRRPGRRSAVRSPTARAALPSGAWRASPGRPRPRILTARAARGEGKVLRPDGRLATVRRMPKKLKPVPKGYHSVTPALNQADAAQTIDFCKKAFGAKEKMRLAGPGGKIMHAELEIGDSVIMLNDAMQEPAQPAALFLYVPDVDKTFAKA